MNNNAAPTRHHPALVALHWLIAVLLVVALGMGTLSLQNMPNSSPDKIFALRGHMIAGGVILVLMLARLVLRLRTRRPAAVSTGHPVLDRLAPAMHAALYVLVFVMAGSGIGMAVLAGLPDIVFGGVGSLPASFDTLLPRAVHGATAALLMALIALHVAAALYHQFVRRDGLMSRMGFGRR